MWLNHLFHRSLGAKSCFYVFDETRELGMKSKEYYFTTRECEMKFKFLHPQMRSDWTLATPTHLGAVYAVGL